ncbi:uncharacterized protein LOC142317739 [Lycorma delicatula]|uniref:uncharacterized protein LOC142317739 n=1 Tax=Lycorma delicatula TaxID=130591 RepID=UPI003F510FCE
MNELESPWPPTAFISRLSPPHPPAQTAVAVGPLPPSFFSVLVWTWCFTTLGLTEDVPEGVPILKEINRVNDDGSYTFGYEAADGSFKIETRDVQGNVKGMFGYIDEAGDLKRVSYTANNGTGFQSMSTTAKPKEQDDSSSRRPILILRQPTSTRAPVIQHIPRKSATSESSQSTTTPAYGEYIKGRKPVMEIIVNSASSNLEVNTEENQELTPTPSPPSLRRILVTRRPVEDTTTPRTPRYGKGGNALRRQLVNEPNSRPVDTPDVYPEEGNSRYITPTTRFPNPLLSSLLPQSTPAYRNHLLTQNSGRIPPYLLRPEYPTADPTFQPPFDPQEPPEVTTVSPIPQTSFPTQHRLYPQGPLPHVPPVPPVPRKFRPASPFDDQQYSIPVGQDPPRRYRPLPNVPQISPVLQQKPMYPPDADYNQGNQIQSLNRLMEYILQLLQQKTGTVGPGFSNRFPVPQYYNPGYYPYNQNPYPNQNPYYPNSPMPFNPYQNQYIPYPNQPLPYNPYTTPNYPYQNPNLMYPNIPNIPPVPQSYVPPVNIAPAPVTPYSTNPNSYTNPNIQYSQQIAHPNVPPQNYSPQLTEARIGPPQLRSLRPTNPTPVNEISQQELFRMLIAASTRATPSQSFAPTTEPPNRSTQPVRNVQILGSASEAVTHRVITSSTTAKDEMEETSR